jgi:EmrB/QacA subfamily drug resistance transporter
MTTFFAGALFMELLDTTVILTALPNMARTFGVNPVDLSIGITSYMLAMSALLPASGWIADHFGTRRVFLVAIAGFALASVLCGLSGSLPMFVAARLLQGAAAAIMAPVARLTMLKSMERKQLARAMNTGAMAGLVGPAIGPPLGGFLTTYWSWRWIFLMNIPIAILAFVLAWRSFPEVRAAHERRFDRRGFALNAIASVAVLYGLQSLSESGRDWRIGAALAAFGVGIGLLSIRHSRRDPHPLLEFTALRIATFRASVINGALFRSAFLIPVFVLPLLLQLGMGFSAFKSGLYILASATADVLAKVFLIWGLRRMGHRKVLIWSAALYALFPLALMLVNASTPWLVLALLMVFGGATRSWQMTTLHTFTFVDVPQRELSGASTFASVTQQLSQPMAVASAALVINATVWWLGGATHGWQVADFHPALLLTMVLTLATLRWYWPLSPAAGAEVSGYAPQSRG